MNDKTAVIAAMAAAAGVEMPGGEKNDHADERTPLEAARFKIQLARVQNLHPRSGFLDETDLSALPKVEQDRIAAAKAKRERRANRGW